MNKKTKTVALFALLATMAVSCQKEDIADHASEVPFSDTNTVYMVQYVIGGVPQQASLHSLSERRDFFRYLLTQARNGSEVVVYDETATSCSIATKEVVQYSTTSEQEASAWAEKMVESGYRVTITFDTEKKIYNCVARR